MLMLHIDSLMGAESKDDLRQQPPLLRRLRRQGRDPLSQGTRGRALSAVRRKPAPADRQAG